MFILLPVALLFAAGALLAFIWAARSGQFDDLVTPGLRILHEDEDPVIPSPRHPGSTTVPESPPARQ